MNNVKIIYITDSDDDILKGEVMKHDVKEAELYQSAGLQHIPEAGAEGVIISLNRGGSHNIVICPKVSRDSDVPNTDAGETLIYSTSGGNIQAKILLDKNGNVVINDGVNGVAREGDSVEVTIPAGSFLISASAGVPNPNPVTVTGTITSASNTVKAGD